MASESSRDRAPLTAAQLEPEQFRPVDWLFEGAAAGGGRRGAATLVRTRKRTDRASAVEPASESAATTGAEPRAAAAGTVVEPEVAEPGVPTQRPDADGRGPARTKQPADPVSQPSTGTKTAAKPAGGPGTVSSPGTRPVAPSAPTEPGTSTESAPVEGESREAAPFAPAEAPPGLSERDRAVLTFEKQYWRYAGSKEQAIRDRFGLSATRYYQVLNALLDNPAAQEAEPVVVKRLRRMRAARQRARTGTGAPRPRSAGI